MEATRMTSRRAAKMLLRFQRAAHRNLCYFCIHRMERDVLGEAFSHADARFDTSAWKKHEEHKGERRVTYWQPPAGADVITQAWLAAFSV